MLRRRAYIDVHFNEYDKAIEKAEQSCSIFDKEIGTPSADWADSLDILGRLYRDRGVYEFKCAMQAGLRESELENARARRDEDFSRAEDLIDRGYRMAQEIGDKYKEAESHLSYVWLYHYQEDFQRSLQFYEKGVAICRPLEYHLLLSYFELFAGISYFRMHDYERTFEHFALRGLYA